MIEYAKRFGAHAVQIKNAVDFAAFASQEDANKMEEPKDGETVYMYLAEHTCKQFDLEYGNPIEGQIEGNRIIVDISKS